MKVEASDESEDESENGITIALVVANPRRPAAFASKFTTDAIRTCTPLSQAAIP